MCGRFTLTSIPDSFAEDFDIESLPDCDPRYNIAPTQDVMAVVPGQGGVANEVVLLRWGLVPSWSGGPAGPPLINARAESLDKKPSFRESFERRRCLIPADGYYEWKQAGGYRQPYHIRLRGGGVFAMAGVWDRWVEPAGRDVRSCAVVTTGANSLTAGIHDRMPVILTPEASRSWLSPTADRRGLLGMLVPYASQRMEVEAVNPLVNSAANDGPECLKPAELNLELGL